MDSPSSPYIHTLAVYYRDVFQPDWLMAADDFRCKTRRGSVGSRRALVVVPGIRLSLTRSLPCCVSGARRGEQDAHLPVRRVGSRLQASNRLTERSTNVFAQGLVYVVLDKSIADHLPKIGIALAVPGRLVDHHRWVCGGGEKQGPQDRAVVAAAEAVTSFPCPHPTGRASCCASGPPTSCWSW